ncbi:DNA primase [Patescibacteria group bacterium]|nr:DNA primase [Patescibacteria group bacterium]
MDNQVEEIKRKLDIVNVIGRYIPLKKKGRHYTANCPFHGEKTPSFMVSPELQIYKCFGCGKGGDIFTFVQEFEKVDFKEALEELAKLAGITLVRNDALTASEAHRKKLLEINAEVCRFYHYILTKHPLGQPALKYLTDRGITSEIITKFKIGFAPRDSQVISAYLLSQKKFVLRDLVDTGTFGANRYGRPGVYDRFSGRLTFPLMDYRDRILGFSGRILPPEFQPGKAPFDGAKYINSPETELYHKSHLLFGLNFAKDAIRTQGYVIIVEGEFDMISPFAAGVTNIVAIKGTAFTTEQLELLRRYTDTLVLGLDSDFAGNSAARRSIELADSMGFDLKVLSLAPRFKDPDEAVHGDLPFFKKQLENPLPIWDFLINSAVAANDPSTIKGKKLILATVLPFLTKISNSVIRADYIRKLSLEIGSSPESVTQELGKYSAAPAAKLSIPVITAPVKPAAVPTKKLRLIQYLLCLILSSKNPPVVAAKVLATLPDLFKEVPLYQKIIDLLTKEPFDGIENFHRSLPAEIQPTFQAAYLKGLSYNFTSENRRREIKTTVSSIRIFDLKNQLKNQSQQIALLESRGDEALLSVAEKDYNKTLHQLLELESART